MSAPPCYERHPCPDRVYEEKARQRMLDGISYQTGKERRKPR